MKFVAPSPPALLARKAEGEGSRRFAEGAWADAVDGAFGSSHIDRFAGGIDGALLELLLKPLLF